MARFTYSLHLSAGMGSGSVGISYFFMAFSNLFLAAINPEEDMSIGNKQEKESRMQSKCGFELFVRDYTHTHSSANVKKKGN